MVGGENLVATARVFHLMGALTALAAPLTTAHGPVPAVLPGPMEGVMTPWFCRAAARLGLVDGWMTPFLRLSDNLPRRNRFARFLEPFTSSGRPVMLQLLGSDAELLAAAAALAMEHFRPVGIDLNFACPSPTVLRSGGGGAMLRDPAAMARIVAAVRRQLPRGLLSVKIRTGFERPEEMERIVPALAGAGVDFMSVHFRAVTEVYRATSGREARLRRAVALASGIPVVGSGDVYTVADAEILAGCGCSGVMGARGWLRDPLLLRRIAAAAAGAVEERGDLRREFFLALRDEAAGWDGPWPRPGLTGAAAFMWGADSPMFRALLALDDQSFRFGPLPSASA